MPWSRIFFVDGCTSPSSAWVRTVFQHLYEATSAHDYDELALYAANDGQTLYFSPRATARFGAAVSRFHLLACERPSRDAVVLLLGDPRAEEPGWCELPYWERHIVEEGDRVDREAA